MHLISFDVHQQNMMIMSCRIDCGEPKRAQTENLLEVSEVFVTSAKRSMPGIVPLQCLPSPFVLDEQIHMSQKGGTERQNSMTYATSLSEKEKARSRLYMYKYITYFKDKLSILYTSSARTSRGRKFPKGKELYSTERICL